MHGIVSGCQGGFFIAEYPIKYFLILMICMHNLNSYSRSFVSLFVFFTCDLSSIGCWKNFKKDFSGFSRTKKKFFFVWDSFSLTCQSSRFGKLGDILFSPKTGSWPLHSRAPRLSFLRHLPYLTSGQVASSTLAKSGQRN